MARSNPTRRKSATVTDIRQALNTGQALAAQRPTTGATDRQVFNRKVDSLSMHLNAIDDMTAVVCQCLMNQDCDLDAACASILNSVTTEIEHARKALGDLSVMVPRVEVSHA